MHESYMLLLFLLCLSFSLSYAFVPLQRPNSRFHNNIGTGKINALKCQTESTKYSPSQSRGILPFLSGMLSVENGKKAFSWGAFFATCYGFRNFGPIIIVTFFFSHLGTRIVSKMQNFNPTTKELPRKFFASLYIFLVASLFAYSLVAVSPRILREAQNCLEIIQSDNPYKIIADATVKILGSDVSSRLEQFLSYMLVSGGIVKDLVGQGPHLEKLLQHSIQHYTESALALGSRIISSSTTILYNAVLSFVLSFMIIWDAPKIKKGVARLSNSRIGFVFNEVAPKIGAFSNLLGQSFEVQALTSLVNAILTSLVLLSLRIPGLGFFAVLTFFSSFVPILGIAICTIPPLIVALCVHLIEAYLLYPQIYAVRLKMHPLLVTGALVLAEHYAGIPGLLLAVPVTLFIVNQLLFENKG